MKTFLAAQLFNDFCNLCDSFIQSNPIQVRYFFGHIICWHFTRFSRGIFGESQRNVIAIF
jgi:hypothetical protein